MPNITANVQAHRTPDFLNSLDPTKATDAPVNTVLGLIYGGLVRSKNALNTMMMSYISFGFVGVLWAVIGYSLAFATGNDYLGDLSRLFLKGVGLEPQGTIPHYLFMCYQGTFAIITAALISGAIADRARFAAWVVFVPTWTIEGRSWCPWSRDAGIETLATRALCR